MLKDALIRLVFDQVLLNKNEGKEIIKMETSYEAVKKILILRETTRTSLQDFAF